MLISCTSVAVCQIMTAFLLWRVETLTSTTGASVVRCSLMWLAAAALIMLGLCESAIDWVSGDKRMKDPPIKVNGRLAPPRVQMSSTMVDDDDLSSSPMKPPSLARTMSLVSEEDEADGKSCLRLLHMLAAFAVVGLNVASQWIGGDASVRPVSSGMSAIGGGAFFIFCMMVRTAHSKCSCVTLGASDNAFHQSAVDSCAH